HFRDEWRELALSRVDEIQEESEIGVKTKLPFLPRTAIFKTGVGQFCALRVGQFCALRVGQFCALRVGQFCALSSRGSDVLHPRPRSECSSCKGTFPRGVGGSSLPSHQSIVRSRHPNVKAQARFQPQPGCVGKWFLLFYRHGVCSELSLTPGSMHVMPRKRASNVQIDRLWSIINTIVYLDGMSLSKVCEEEGIAKRGSPYETVRYWHTGRKNPRNPKDEFHQSLQSEYRHKLFYFVR